jgi:sugar phosphate isomerase/epimerase
VDETVDDKTVEEYMSAARANDIIIAEVGAWSNPIHPDENERKIAIEKCIHKLDLADRIAARCCVNVSGSRGRESNGSAHPENLTEETFQMIVETTRKIIDAVKPRRTFFTLEMMPWSYPDSTGSYLELIKAISRKEFAVHLDPVNLMNSPASYYGNAGLIRDAFRRLGKYIKSCHAKDTILRNDLTLHIDECVPGTGYLDYRAYLSELSRLDNVPLMMEHMNREEYPVAAGYIRKTGREIGCRF